MSVMSQKDRTELRRILKARFDILQRQLEQRRGEVSNSIRSQIETEYEKTLADALKRSRALEKKFAALVEEANDLQAEMEAKGVSPSGHRRSYGYNLASYTLNHNWRPVDIDKTVSRAWEKISEQAGLHKLDLNMRQLELEEEIAIGALGSDEAKQFLGKIPQIDNLLPAADIKKLTQEVIEHGSHDDEE